MGLVSSGICTEAPLKGDRTSSTRFPPVMLSVDCIPDVRHNASETLNYHKQRCSWLCAGVQTHVLKRAPAKDSKQYADQTSSASSTMERVPVEVWQQILLKVMEMDEAPIFATSCTPYTFLFFVFQQTRISRNRKAHRDYLKQRRCLRLVCRTWNEFVVFTGHRWLQLDEGSAMYKLDSTMTTAPGARGVGLVERLSTTISSEELATPILSWVSHILKRPAEQSPLRVYTLRLFQKSVQGYNPFDDLLVGTTTTPEPECTNTNTTLRSLSIATFGSIAFPQISRTFTGLRSLFLININATPAQTLSLAHLEVFYVHQSLSAFATLQQPMELWDTPSLRHVHLEYFTTKAQLTGVLEMFLGRYAHQIESLALVERSKSTTSFLDLPTRFWTQFTALRLLGFDAATLEREDWSGWSVVPPPTHPLRYLVCLSQASAVNAVSRVRPRWTWHDGVRLVAGENASESYYVVKDIRDDQWSLKMENTYGILPE